MTKIPALTVEGQDGPIALDRIGAPLVVYFYPKDDTSGCTREALDFTALAAEFVEAGVRVIGVSKDSLAAHAKFTAKHGLAVELASDPDGAACEAFGVWGEKKLYGKTYIGIERATFLFDANGDLVREWRKVKVLGHAEAVLAAAREQDASA
ncbi:peroxiredoxin [Sphingomonas abaci]|uniref:thioredoxin-dependent peroxiredoxin n=1 Tax=Sphingomonas abaci TaxID=237611 RepID=A0A7W7EYJ4_9SPHN|nr:peroxiredoxin [Sphingomonas abaci]MBB4618737.1 peroxiredoxin Q/BCP [Sphingomonas abaci]